MPEEKDARKPDTVHTRDADERAKPKGKAEEADLDVPADSGADDIKGGRFRTR